MPSILIRRARVCAMAAASVLALVFSVAPPARACAVCSAGDPTLTAAGSELPYEGRLRVGAAARVGRVRVGEPGAGEIVLDDRRLELTATYAPRNDLLLTLAVPGLDRRIAQPGAGGGKKTDLVLGDVELRMTHAAWTSADSGRRFGLIGALKAPTAPIENDVRGAPLPAELQPGCSSIVPRMGAYYALLSGKWSGYFSATLDLPFSIRDAPHPGESLRTTSFVQLQASRKIAGRAGVSTRLDATGEYQGATDPSSGGFVGYVTSELVVSPATDLVLSAGGYFPMLQALKGTHREGAIFVTSVAYDF